MAKQTYQFTYKELAALLVREAGVKRGHWGVRIHFGLHASNIGQDENTLLPAAIVAVTEIGLQEFEAPSNLTVDAAEIAAKGDAPE